VHDGAEFGLVHIIIITILAHQHKASRQKIL